VVYPLSSLLSYFGQILKCQKQYNICFYKTQQLNLWINETYEYVIVKGIENVAFLLFNLVPLTISCFVYNEYTNNTRI